MARSEVAYSVEDALAIADKLGYPVVLRPAYTMGGAGGGLVYNVEELKTVCARGLQASMVGQVLVEESILGWEELELEVVRDAKNNMITVCFIENIDPLGVHRRFLLFCSDVNHFGRSAETSAGEILQDRRSNPGNRRYQRTVGTRSVRQTVISSSRSTREPPVRPHWHPRQLVSRLHWYQRCWQPV